ncbi:MAG: HTTM domain-containing protein [Myxococcota bacterium]
MSWLTAERSTRPMGLLRVLLPLIAWSRWGEELLPYHDLSPDRLALSLAFFTCTTWMLVGWYGRLATAATAGVMAVIVFGYGRAWGVEDWAHHHTTLLGESFALLALTPCSASFSLDRWLVVSRARAAGLPPPPERGPSWAVGLIALQVSTVYFWSAFDKTNLPFLSGARLEQIFVELYWTSDWTSPGWARLLFFVGGAGAVALEYTLAVALWVPRVRGAALIAGLALHAAFYVLLPVGTFSVTMVALYLAFVDADAFHRAVDRLLSPSGGE